MGSGLNQRRLRHQPDHFTPRYRHALLGCAGAYRFKRDMDRGDDIIGEIHRDLNQLTTGQFHSDSFEMGQPAIGLANVLGNRSGQRQIRRAKIHIEGNQGRSRTDYHGTRSLMEMGGTKIWCPVRIGGQAEGEAPKPPSTDRFERSMISMHRRMLVEEYRDLQFCSYSLSQSLRQLNTILHRRAAHRHERNDVRCPHSWMDALVFPKIDEISRHANGAKGRFNDGIRLTGKAQDGAMVIPIHRAIQ